MIVLPVTGVTVLAQSADDTQFRPRSTLLLGVEFDDDGVPTRLLHEYAGQLVVLVVDRGNPFTGTVAGAEVFRYHGDAENRLRDMHRAALRMRGEVPHRAAEAYTDLDGKANDDNPATWSTQRRASRLA